MNRKCHILVALLLSCNYFAFQVELFDEEYEANHPAQSNSGVVSLSSLSLNWETFDKENAPAPFTFEPFLHLQSLFPFPPSRPLIVAPAIFCCDIRDKSPPAVS